MLERIKIPLRSLIIILRIIILPLHEHIIDESNRQLIQIRHRQTQLHTTEQKQRRRHFPVNRTMFF